jgi:hypothetical protein
MISMANDPRALPENFTNTNVRLKINFVDEDKKGFFANM